MPSSSLQGLNVVYPTAADDNKDYYPDIADQLSLWTNVSFVDEPSLPFNKNEDIPSLSSADPSVPDDTLHHVPSMTPSPNPQHSLPVPGHPPVGGQFDFSSFLAGFGIDPFLAPLQPLPDAVDTSFTSGRQASPSSALSPETPASITETEVPVTKRARTQTKRAAASTATRAVSEAGDDPEVAAMTVAAAEDKRRRNTAASARFRAKKKEREQAMEKRSKELENRVNELERECEGLRRENGWLKGLVVGVTSGNPANIPPPPADVSEPSSITDTTQETGKKRKREPVDG